MSLATYHPCRCATFDKVNPMLDRFNASIFVGLGRCLQELADRAPTSSRIDLLESIVGTQVYLDLFYTTKYIAHPPIPLKTSKNAGQSLHSVLEKMHEKLAGDASSPLGLEDTEALKEAMDRFETVLNADLARAFTYAVSQVGILVACTPSSHHS
jgi:hypothetical protein